MIETESGPVPGDRGTGATIVLAVLALINLYGLLLVLNGQINPPPGPRVPVAGVLIALGLLTLASAGLAGIWRWHRWGLYVYGTALGLFVLVALVAQASIIVPLVPVALFVLLIRMLSPRWP
jgi:hypothetical protein